MEINFNTWHVAFVQDCNLKCTYCATGFGSFGDTKGLMKKAVWQRLGQLMIDYSKPGEVLQIQFGVGETFLYFEKWLAFIRYIDRLAEKNKVSVNLQIATNGTTLDSQKLMLLADRNASLNFSIDGPEYLHNRHRKTTMGQNSFKLAMKNWQLYKKMPQKPACNVQSVFTNESSLSDIVKFWADQKQPVFSCVIQLPSRFTEEDSYEAWNIRQHAYLDDFRTLAFSLAHQLRIPTFLSNYKGPEELFVMWIKRFLETEANHCGPGESTISVDIEGNLYPCETFIGVGDKCIGNVFDGINESRLSLFRHERRQAIARCQNCPEKMFCPKNCLGRDPFLSLDENFESGCWFAKELTKIASESYIILSSDK